MRLALPPPLGRRGAAGLGTGGRVHATKKLALPARLPRDPSSPRLAPRTQPKPRLRVAVRSPPRSPPERGCYETGITERGLLLPPRCAPRWVSTRLGAPLAVSRLWTSGRRTVRGLQAVAKARARLGGSSKRLAGDGLRFGFAEVRVRTASPG